MSKVNKLVLITMFSEVRVLKLRYFYFFSIEITFFLYFRKQSTETTTPSGSPATVTSGELRRAINLANAENIVGGSGSPARSPKPSCSSTGNKQIGPQAAVSTQKLSQVSSVSYI